MTALKPTHHTITSNEITLHYLEYGNTNSQTIVCLHGLTGNAHAFDGIISQGLKENFRIISVDLRGRGLSSHPAFHYTMEDHAKDILGLLDHLQITQANLMGHSFGGLLSSYLAYRYPDRVARFVMLDAAAELNPDVAEMLVPALQRLDIKYKSWDAYITEIKKAPYMNFWTDDMLYYHKADVMDTDEGGVTPIPNLANIIQASLAVSNEPWEVYMADIEQPVLLINAPGIYTMGQPLLPEIKAKETVALIKNAEYVCVEGNHHTMMYGKGAQQIVAAVSRFVPQA